MSNNPIESVEKIYSISEKSIQTFVPVSHPEFRNFCGNVFSLGRKFKEDDNGELAQEFLGSARQFAWDHLQIPISFNHQHSLALVKRSELDTKNAAEVVPNYADELKHIRLSLAELSESDENPMADGFLSLLPDLGMNGTTALVLHKRSSVPFVQGLLREWSEQNVLDGNNFITVTPDQLRDHKHYDSIVVFGQEWVIREGSHVFSAPRSEQIYRIGFPYVRFKRSIESGFDPSVLPEGRFQFTNIGNVGGDGFSTSKSEPGLKAEEESTLALDLDELQPLPDLSKLIQRPPSPLQSPGENEYLVDAQVVGLSNGQAVWLSVNTEEGGRLRSYNVLVSTGLTVEHVRVPVDSLEPGMFLVLRTRGAGGDYIEHVADLILASEAELLRETQIHWKELLRKKVARIGIGDVGLLLDDMGCSVAKAGNIRNWMRPGNIGTLKESDYLILMDYIGLDDKQAQLYWDNAKKLRSAHASAGAYIGDMLLDQIKRIDSYALSAIDELDLQMHSSDVEWGSFTAYRVDKVHDYVKEVDYRQTQILIDLEE